MDIEKGARELVARFRENERVHTEEWDETRYLEQKITSFTKSAVSAETASLTLRIAALEGALRKCNSLFDIQSSACMYGDGWFKDTAEAGKFQISEALASNPPIEPSHPPVPESVKKAVKALEKIANSVFLTDCQNIAREALTALNQAKGKERAVERVALALQTAHDEGVREVIEALEKADPLEAPSHAWEDGPDDLLANDVQKYLVEIARSRQRSSN